MLILFMTGFAVIGGIVPPPPPSWTAAEVARFYTENHTRIEIGLCVAMLGSAFMFPWAVVIALQMKRVEGRWGPLALLELISGGVSCLVFVFPMFAMAVAAYRPQSRSPELVQAFNDLGWLSLLGFVAPICVQLIAIGIAAFVDRRQVAVFARWVGYFNVWCAVLFLPGILVILFTTGPFAWNGIISFWVGLGVLGAWYIVMVPVLLKAIKQEAKEEATGIRTTTAGSA